MSTKPVQAERTQRLERLIKLCKGYNEWFGKKAGKKWLEKMEDFYFHTWIPVSPDEYTQSLFHLSCLIKKHGVKLQGEAPENLMPHNTLEPRKQLHTKQVALPKDLLRDCPPIRETLGITHFGSVMKCPKCDPKITEVSSHEKQTRSADEGQTIFAHCLKKKPEDLKKGEINGCGYKWRVN